MTILNPCFPSMGSDVKCIRYVGMHMWPHRTVSGTMRRSIMFGHPVCAACNISLLHDRFWICQCPCQHSRCLLLHVYMNCQYYHHLVATSYPPPSIVFVFAARKNFRTTMPEMLQPDVCHVYVCGVPACRGP